MAALAGGLRHRVFPHHAAAGAAVLVLLRAADPGRVEMTPFVAAALTFSIQSAAFFAEVFRGGIVSVERGQWEAGARDRHDAATRRCAAWCCRRRSSA
jgi:hypothetical protein